MRSLKYLEEKYIYSQYQPLKLKFKICLIVFRKRIHKVRDVPEVKINLAYKIRKLAPYIWCW